MWLIPGGWPRRASAAGRGERDGRGRRTRDTGVRACAARGERWRCGGEAAHEAINTLIEHSMVQQLDAQSLVADVMWIGPEERDQTVYGGKARE